MALRKWESTERWDIKEEEDLLHLLIAINNNTDTTQYLYFSKESLMINHDFANNFQKALGNNRYLKKLKVVGIQSGGTIAIFEALKVNSTLKTLDLAYNKLGIQGALSIAEALLVNTTLTSLDLSYNNIKKEGGIAIANALKVTSSLTTLNLDFNCIGSEGAIAIAEALRVNPSLKSLSLAKNSIFDNGLIAIADALKRQEPNVSSLEILNLNRNQMYSEAAKSMAILLKENATLKSLSLRCNQIVNKGMIAILESLRENSTLTLLDLGESEIEYLRGSGELSEVLSDVLLINSSLTSLNLDGIQIGDVGALAIANVLKVNSTLLRLNLRNTGIEKQGVIAMAESFRFNFTLSEIIVDKSFLQIFTELDGIRINTYLALRNVLEMLVGEDAAHVLAVQFKVQTPGLKLY